MCALFLPLLNTVVEKTGDYLTQTEKTHQLEVQGKIKEKLTKIEGDIAIEKIKQEGKIDIEKMKIENEKLTINNAHDKDMKGMEYDYLLKDKTIDKEHEINLLKQKQDEKRQDDEMKIKAEDHHAKNLRDMKELEGKINVDMAKAKGEIEANLKKLNIEETANNHDHEQKMQNMVFNHEESIAKMKSDEEKFKIENDRKLEEMKYKNKEEMINLEIKKMK
jgi:hypothetical protein